MKPYLFLITILFGLKPYAQESFFNIYVEYDSSKTCGNLLLTPVRFKNPGESNLYVKQQYLSLKEALQSKKFSVKEMKSYAGADISVLSVINKTGKEVIIAMGDLLDGGKQNRVAAETVVIPSSREPFFLNVFCSEKGRWDKREKRFHYSGSIGPEIKNLMKTSAHQHDIWKLVDTSLAKNKIKSETFSYSAIYNQNEIKNIECYNYFRQQFLISDSVYAGFIGSTDNRIIGAELFSNSTLTNKFFEPLIKSYIYFAETNGSKPDISHQKIHDFINPVLSDAKTREAFIAKNGKQFFYQNKLVHVVLFGDL